MIFIIMEKMICEFCGIEKETKMSFIQHKIFCKENPNRKKVYTENWDEDKKKRHSELMKVKHNNTNRVWKPETIERLKKTSREINKQFWTDEEKQKQSIRMKEVVKRNPQSYSSSNVCGRTKLIEYKGHKLNGKWEFEVAKWLDENNISWTNIIETPFEYYWENNYHNYFPDFYLKDKNLYIEVKGYQRERDECKWKVVPNLIIITKNDMKKIKEGTFTI